MSLNDNAKKLAEYVSGVIEKEKQEAYMAGYTKGLAAGVKDSEDLRNIVNKWICGFNSKLKDAPSAMDTMPVAPEPCVKGMTWKSVKDFFLKLDEEVDELKVEVLKNGELDDDVRDVKMCLTEIHDDESETFRRRIAEEAADVCTVLASLCEALGIGYDIRMEAQRRVNEHNHERGRN